MGRVFFARKTTEGSPHYCQLPNGFTTPDTNPMCSVPVQQK